MRAPTPGPGAPGDRVESGRQIPELDGVRGLAILMVLLFHFTGMLPHWLPGIPFAVVSLGWAGVDLFFVLSGFLITGILIDTRGGRNYFSSFYARRVLRILPLYLLAVFGFFRIALPLARRAGYWLMVDRTLEPWFWLHVSNWQSAYGHDVWLLSPFWSLAVEEQFYLVWPAVVALVKPRRLGLVCAAVVVIVCGVRCIATFRGLPAEALHRLTVFRLDALAMGGLTATLVRSSRAAARRRLGLVTALAVGMLAPLLWFGREATSRSMTTLGYTAIALLFACLVFEAADATGAGGWLCAGLRGRGLRSLGKYSYGMYVLHFPIAVYVARFVVARWDAWSGFTQAAMWTGAVVGGILFTFALALVSWNLVEKRFLALKKYFVAFPPAGQVP